jgi:hypothetical protein
MEPHVSFFRIGDMAINLRNIAWVELTRPTDPDNDDALSLFIQFIDRDLSLTLKGTNARAFLDTLSSHWSINFNR